MMTSRMTPVRGGEDANAEDQDDLQRLGREAHVGVNDIDGESHQCDVDGNSNGAVAVVLQLSAPRDDVLSRGGASHVHIQYASLLFARHCRPGAAGFQMSLSFSQHQRPLVGERGFIIQ